MHDDCIPYIHDLDLEIKMLKKIRKNRKDKEDIDLLIAEKEEELEGYKDDLSKLSPQSVEYKIYLKMLNGMTPSHAVEKTADENYYNDVKPSSVSGVWIYYRKLKKKINNL